MQSDQLFLPFGFRVNRESGEFPAGGIGQDVVLILSLIHICVKTLEDRGFRSSVINAVVDAYKRFDEIGKLKPNDF